MTLSLFLYISYKETWNRLELQLCTRVSGRYFIKAGSITCYLFFNGIIVMKDGHFAMIYFLVNKKEKWWKSIHPNWKNYKLQKRNDKGFFFLFLSFPSLYPSIVVDERSFLSFFFYRLIYGNITKTSRPLGIIKFYICHEEENLELRALNSNNFSHSSRTELMLPHP
jgi:hypothetical protein